MFSSEKLIKILVKRKKEISSGLTEYYIANLRNLFILLLPQEKLVKLVQNANI